MSAAVINIVYITCSVILYFYTIYYGDPTTGSLIFCKLRYYLGHILGQMARYFIAVVCIDRFALTSMNARFRTFSKPSTTRFLIISISAIMHIVPSHIAILTTIENGNCGQYGLYFPFYTAYTVICLGSLQLAVMVVFGYMAYRNARRLHTIVRPTENRRINNRPNTNLYCRDQSLLVMLLAEAAVYVLTMGFYSCLFFL
ncbi:unnamed protein product [Rotaria socialis]|uniref:G-protein coupled receptors family 1 profile domain-containing protein n=1 Tax=Rotaria socialis TaxID=392032 RepID=A0A820UQM1_9BILA|nr:unnamed protein product [Rotaria socialis]CAF4488900.1 unnamed protein product [Rotaria socialis]